MGSIRMTGTLIVSATAALAAGHYIHRCRRSEKSRTLHSFTAMLMPCLPYLSFQAENLLTSHETKAINLITKLGCWKQERVSSFTLCFRSVALLYYCHRLADPDDDVAPPFSVASWMLHALGRGGYGSQTKGPDSENPSKSTEVVGTMEGLLNGC